VGSSGGADFPVFVVGSPRSGTTLVYSILLSSGEFPIYEAESRILECGSRYGRLSNSRNFRRFEQHYRRSRQFVRSGLNPDEFFPRAMEQCDSFLDFLRLFMESMAAAQDKTRWTEKTPNHVLHMEALARAFPTAKFVHMVRDGRDVALSQRSADMTHQFHADPLIQLVWGAKVWDLLATQGARSGRALGDRYLELRYEQVVTRLDETIDRLSAFTEIDLDKTRIAQTKVGALARANTAFTDEEMEGVSQNAKERWKERLDPEEQRALEWTIGGSLRRFGYSLSDPPLPAPGARVRMHARLAPAALLAKRYLNRYTPIGRLGVVPLELDLT
jgi:hypothetical protein